MQAPRDVVAIGASAGGIPVLREILASLEADLPAAILVVLHIGARESFVLPRLLGRPVKVTVEEARDGHMIRPGHVYLAPPDLHLLLRAGGRLALSHGPRENRFRPSVDALFRSAAETCGKRVIGVVLSGGLDHGAFGR